MLWKRRKRLREQLDCAAFSRKASAEACRGAEGGLEREPSQIEERAKQLEL